MTPGVDHREIEAFFKITAYEGEPRREAVMFTVKFENGAAEVGEELGEYLIRNDMASGTPAPVIRKTQQELEADGNLGRPVYAKPIEVGRPLTPEGGMSPPAPPGLVDLIRREFANMTAAVTRRL